MTVTPDSISPQPFVVNPDGTVRGPTVLAQTSLAPGTSDGSLGAWLNIATFTPQGGLVAIACTASGFMDSGSPAALRSLQFRLDDDSLSNFVNFLFNNSLEHHIMGTFYAAARLAAGVARTLQVRAYSFFMHIDVNDYFECLVLEFPVP